MISVFSLKVLFLSILLSNVVCSRDSDSEQKGFHRQLSATLETRTESVQAFDLLHTKVNIKIDSYIYRPTTNYDEENCIQLQLIPTQPANTQGASGNKKMSLCYSEDIHPQIKGKSYSLYSAQELKAENAQQYTLRRLCRVQPAEGYEFIAVLDSSNAGILTSNQKTKERNSQLQNNGCLNIQPFYLLRETSSTSADDQYWLELLPKLLAGCLLLWIFYSCLTNCRQCRSMLASLGYSDQNIHDNQTKLIDRTESQLPQQSQEMDSWNSIRQSHKPKEQRNCPHKVHRHCFTSWKEAQVACIRCGRKMIGYEACCLKCKEPVKYSDEADSTTSSLCRECLITV